MSQRIKPQIGGTAGIGIKSSPKNVYAVNALV